MPEIPPKLRETTSLESENTTIEYGSSEPPPLPLGKAERIQRCLACLGKQAMNDPNAPPITAPNISACLNIRVTTNQDLGQLVGNGQLAVRDEPAPRHPLNRASNTKQFDLLRPPVQAAPEECGLEYGLFHNLIRTRRASMGVIAYMAENLTRARITRAEILQAHPHLEKIAFYIFPVFIEAGYLQKTGVKGKTEVFEYTEEGLAFFGFARRYARVRTDNQAFEPQPLVDAKTEPVQDHLPFTQAELLDQLANLTPPFTVRDVTESYPASSSTVRRLFGRLQAEGYLVQKPRVARESIGYSLSAKGYELFADQKPQDAPAEQQTLIEKLFAIELLRQDDTNNDLYNLGPFSIQFTKLQVQAYLHHIGLDALVYGTALDAHHLAQRAKYFANTTVEELAAVVTQGVLGALSKKRVEPESGSTHPELTKRIVRCIGCIAARGVHQEGAVVNTSDLISCAGGSKNQMGVALRELANQNGSPVARDMRAKRHTRYVLTASPSPVVVSPSDCLGVTPKLFHAKEAKITPASDIIQPQAPSPTEQYPALKQAKERLQKLGILNDDHILSTLQQCLDKQLLVVKKVAPHNIPQVILRNPTYDQQTKSYITFNPRLAALPPMAQRAIAHHLGVDIVLLGQAEDPHVLKYAVGLASTDSLGDYAEKIIAALLRP